MAKNRALPFWKCNRYAVAGYKKENQLRFHFTAGFLF